jgi:tetratricopeptide (TPR) repeat protein
VSIDSPGVVVWGWLLGGAIVGLSFQSESDSSEQNFVLHTSRKSVSAKSLQPLISYPLTVAVMIIFSFIYRNEIAIEQTSRIPSEIQNYTYVKNISELNLKKPLVPPFHKVRYAVQLGNSGFFNEAILVLEEVNKIDKKNIVALDLLAVYYYETGKTNLAIEQRVRIISLDPWGANNYYLLGLLYLDSGDLEKAGKMREKVLSFAANTEIGNRAKTELVP